MADNKTDSHVAIIEGDPDSSVLLQTFLQQDGFRTSSFGNGSSFLSVMETIKPDVCLIALSLPDQDGMKLLDVIISSTDSASIIISDRSAADEKITALKLGADDYIVKPFEPNEVVARVHAVLRRTRRTKPSEKLNEIAAFGNWEIDFNTYKLSWVGEVEKEDQYLSHGEAAILKVFVDNPNRLLSRSQILDQITDDPDLNFDRSVDVRISRLRSKLEDNPRKPVLIKTVYGAGYLFVSQVVWS